MDTTLDITALEAEGAGLLAAVKNGRIVLESISKDLTTLESGVDVVEAELAKIDAEFAASEEERRREEAALLADMQKDVAEEEAEDADLI